ncbi:preprotein translocase subunit SecE [Mycobacteroides abscessus]|uniref:preprotein translocase subunit SecE n=1 Tax=Mycobacteroides abscessus TaxID=36809 RepID=UPI00078D7FB9|nr:preprotein translocase subunit SecE [Mycobacteroides abscessus]AMU32431.1 preprotein translocase subunit SecE [Mycobacteroides abscessus]MDO3031508.1 preprotein translocase subunit SecE [Mycobacteroides abscessus subsp. massiliense]PVA54670.1 preprotein translocase subunit SecE [Mycobacteroides abscessus]PVA94991.1 preprotein translocase subunit SecE [Mycobacteroides abscessus]PVB09327.1 preprotein translocase subunit SecE [Mycobacteroides abscessus]
MSDELDEPDIGTADSDRAVTSTKPLRPTGKRTRRADATEAVTEGGEASASETGEVKKKAGKKSRKPANKKDKSGPSRNPLVQLWVFLQQVVAELRKVIWPNRKQMVSYTSVVLVFLVFMVTLIGVIDLGLARLVMLVFG